MSAQAHAVDVPGSLKKMELELDKFRMVQDAARYTLDAITEFIRPGISEIELVHLCDTLQRGAGIDSYWYKSLPALVLVGKRSTLAISREPYTPGDFRIQDTDLVNIDLNPAIDGYCGDYARTYYIEDGKVRRRPQLKAEFIRGDQAQITLHALLYRIARPELTFDGLLQVMQKEILHLGFEQLDAIGHNVQREMDRTGFDCMELGSSRTLGEAGFFTLEPHIRVLGGSYGFKHENIYYFDGPVLREL